jgi:hypothetical protein
MTPNARLSFASNGTRAVLNDRRSGATWAVQRSGELIDNWDDLITVSTDTPEERPNNDDATPEVEKVQQPPIAVDDAFGARPGRSTILPVLLNDYDPNGDVLVVDELVPIDPAIGRVDLVNARQQIQLTLAPGASGVVAFVRRTSGATEPKPPSGSAIAIGLAPARSADRRQPASATASDARPAR